MKCELRGDQGRNNRFCWPFNEKKATQVAARMLTLAAGRRLPYMSLIKLMYFADREAFSQWAAPITYDRYYSLDHGPVLSAVKDLIDEGPSGEGSYWSTFISPPANYMVELIDSPGEDELSKAEITIIDNIFSMYGQLNRWDLVDKTHELPEWKDPKGSALPISVKDILEGVGYSAEEAQEAAAELQSVSTVHAFLSR